MPQITIRERDYTTAPAGEYQNFAVVVPGFVDSEHGYKKVEIELSTEEYNTAKAFINSDADKLVKTGEIPAPSISEDVESRLPADVNKTLYAELQADEQTYKFYYHVSVFDENNICELSSQAEFIDKIGQVAPFAFANKETKSADTEVTTYKHEYTKKGTDYLGFIVSGTKANISAESGLTSEYSLEVVDTSVPVTVQGKAGWKDLEGNINENITKVDKNGTIYGKWGTAHTDYTTFYYPAKSDKKVGALLKLNLDFAKGKTPEELKSDYIFVKTGSAIPSYDKTEESKTTLDAVIDNREIKTGETPYIYIFVESDATPTYKIISNKDDETKGKTVLAFTTAKAETFAVDLTKVASVAHEAGYKVLATETNANSTNISGGFVVNVMPVEISESGDFVEEKDATPVVCSENLETKEISFTVDPAKYYRVNITYVVNDDLKALTATSTADEASKYNFTNVIFAKTDNCTVNTSENLEYFTENTSTVNVADLVAGYPQDAVLFGTVTYGETSIKAGEVVKTLGAPAHYGNQIAYELLGLGYSVLYVNMGTWDPKYPIKMRQSILKLCNMTCDDTDTTPSVLADADSIWAPLRDKAAYDFRFITHGLINSNTGENLVNQANNIITELAAFAHDVSGEDANLLTDVSVRGDAIALLDLDEDMIEAALSKKSRTPAELIKAFKYAVMGEQGSGLSLAHGEYAAIFAPSVCYSNFGGELGYNFNNKFPASFHYLACFANSVFNLGYAEWFAPAGFTRGVAVPSINSTEYKLGEIAINALEPRNRKGTGECAYAVNVIAKIRDGYYMWGNRTAKALNTIMDTNPDLVAQHFLNIRQLCTTLKKQIYTACRRFTFDPNSDVLWINFCEAIRPTLERMKANQGIKEYKIVKVPTTQKAKLKARVRIVPIEAVEDFDIEISLEDEFGATNATISE